MNTRGTKFLAVLAILAMAFAIVTVLPSDSSDAVEAEKAIVELRGDIVGTDEALTFDANQKVILIGNANVGTDTQAAHMVVNGELEIPAGYKLTVVGNSTLTIQNGAQALIDGTLVVDDYLEGYDKTNQGFIVKGGDVIISGSATVNGFMSMEADEVDPTIVGKVTVKEGGEFTIGALGELNVATGGKLIIEKNATATIKGICAADTIENSGTVVLKTEQGISDDVKIIMMANGAIVDVQKVILANEADGAHSLIITDLGQVLYSKKDVEIKVDETAAYPSNTVTIGSSVGEGFQDVVSGLYVKEKVSSAPGEVGDIGYVAENERTYTWNMEIYGNVTAKQETVDPESTEDVGSPIVTIDVAANRGAAVADGTTLDIGANITFTNVAGSQLTVAGFLNAHHGSESASSQATVLNNGIIIMSGTGIMEVLKKLAIPDGAEIRGAMIDYSDYVQYMKLDLAIATGNNDTNISEITVVGTDDVAKTATVRADLTIKANAPFTIGANDNTVVLTMAEDSSLRGTGPVTVGGTLFAENKTNVRTDVISDVYSEEVDEKGKPIRDGWAKWTNLQTALAEATEGTKITVSTEGLIILKSNTEVKKGVTLYVPNACDGIVLRNGVTLTINGTYDNESNIYAEANFDTVAKNVTDDRTSAIVVNGKMINNGDVYGYNIDDTRKNQVIDDFEAAIADEKCPELGKDKAPIAGAYYSTEDGAIVSKLESALMNVDDITGDITVKGAVTAGDIIFIATEDCDEIVIFAGVKDLPTVFEVGNLLLSGSKITVDTDGTYFGELTGTITDGINAVKVKGLSSAADNNEAVIAESEDVFSIAGGFYLNDKNDSFSVSEGTVQTKTGVAFTGDYSSATIASGATLEAAGDSASFKTLTVNGTLYVPNGKAISAEDVKVFGNIIVAEPTASKSAGNMTSNNLFVGISSFGTKTTSATASIIGPIATPTVKAVVLNGSSIDESAQAAIDELTKVTEFYVKDTLWITVYASGNDAIRDADGKYYYVPTDLENCDFLSWQNSRGTAVSKETYVGAVDKVYAEIDYDIYSVKIVTDSGIKAVSIDNIQMLRSPAEVSGTNTFTTLHNIEAGTHKVTYTLQDGYEGTATLYTEYGTILQNLSFTVSGTDADDRDLTLQLYGTEKEVPAPTPEPEKESEWTITTILLLILVILIAIMAVIVAMRLMRS